MEDCCKPTDEKDNTDNMEKGGESKMKIGKIILWAIIAILTIAVIYVVFFRGGVSSGSVVSTGQAVKQASGGMVGGC